MYVTEHVDPWKGPEDRLQKLGAAFPALFASAMVKDGEGRSVRNQDVQTIWNLRPKPLAVFRLRLAKCSAVERSGWRPPNLQPLDFHAGVHEQNGVRDCAPVPWLLQDVLVVAGHDDL